MVWCWGNTVLSEAGSAAHFQGALLRLAHAQELDAWDQILDSGMLHSRSPRRGTVSGINRR